MTLYSTGITVTPLALASLVSVDLLALPDPFVLVLCSMFFTAAAAILLIVTALMNLKYGPISANDIY